MPLEYKCIVDDIRQTFPHNSCDVKKGRSFKVK